jgi:hypothetical protein
VVLKQFYAEMQMVALKILQNLKNQIVNSEMFSFDFAPLLSECGFELLGTWEYSGNE